MGSTEKTYLIYLFVAYSVLFLAMFGFMVRMLKHSRQLERDFEQLSRALPLLEKERVQVTPTTLIVTQSPLVHGEKV